jgi:chromosome segregation ATPase
MKKETAFNVGGLIAQMAFTVVIIAISLSLAGCNDQMARIEESQLELQAMVEANAERMALIASNLEQSWGLLAENQHELEIRVENVQNGTQDVAADMAAVADEQGKIYEMMQSNNQQLSNEITVIGQNQHELHALIGTVQNDTQTLTSTVASVTDEQIRLHQTVQENSRQMADMVAAIEQNQQQWQNTINSIQENVQRLTVSIDALGQNLLILQEVLQNSVRELAEIRGADGSIDFELSDAFTSPSETNSLR